MIMRVYALAGLLAYLPAVHSTTNSVVAAAAAMEGGRQGGWEEGGRAERPQPQHSLTLGNCRSPHAAPTSLQKMKAKRLAADKIQ